jgi:hypothetical protein
MNVVADRSLDDLVGQAEALADGEPGVAAPAREVPSWAVEEWARGPGGTGLESSQLPK